MNESAAAKSYPNPGHRGRTGQVGGSLPRAEGGAAEQAEFDPNFALDPADAQRFTRAARRGNTPTSSGLGGGVTESQLASYPDDGDGIWKPLVSHSPKPMAEYHDGNAEVVAYNLATLLGMDVVPPTVYSEQDGVAGSSQMKIDGFRSGTELWSDGQKFNDWAVLSVTDVLDIAALDAIIGNADRHDGNWGIDVHGKLWAIDHGHADFGQLREFRGILARSDDAQESDLLWFARYSGKLKGKPFPHTRRTSEGLVGFLLPEAQHERWSKIERAQFDAAFAGHTDKRKAKKQAEQAWQNLQTILSTGAIR